MKKILLVISIAFSATAYGSDVVVDLQSSIGNRSTYKLSIDDRKSNTGDSIDKIKEKCEELTINKESSGVPIDLLSANRGNLEAICTVYY